MKTKALKFLFLTEKLALKEFKSHLLKRLKKEA